MNISIYIYFGALFAIFLAAWSYGHEPASTVGLNPDTMTPRPSNMSSGEFRVFNRLAVQMDFYHNLLRSSWDELYKGTAPNTKSPSASRLIDLGLHFCQHLKGHHDIEETMWFPVLGRKIEGFRPGHFATEQHKEMHKGLDVLTPYLQACKMGRQDFRRDEVRSIMDSFGGILWTHLDEEVRELGAENMQKHWTKEEMQRMPF